MSETNVFSIRCPKCLTPPGTVCVGKIPAHVERIRAFVAQEEASKTKGEQK